MKLDGALEIGASQQTVWAVLLDPTRLCQIIPGCEEIQQIDETHFATILAVKVQFMTVRATATCELVEVDPSSRLVAVLTGETTVFAGAFRNLITITLTEAECGTRLDYEIDLSLLGRLASLGQPIIRSAANLMVRQFEENLRQLLERPEVSAT